MDAVAGVRGEEDVGFGGVGGFEGGEGFVEVEVEGGGGGAAGEAGVG